MSFWDHLEVLRGTLFRSVLAITLVSVVVFCFKKFVFDDVVLAPTRSDFWVYRLFNMDVKMNLVNKIAGTAFGLVKALCISSVVLSGLVLIDTVGNFISEDTRERRMLYSPVNNTGHELISSLKEYIEEHPDLTKKIVETDEKTSDKVSEKTKKVEEKKSKKESGKKGGHK